MAVTVWSPGACVGLIEHEAVPVASVMAEQTSVELAPIWKEIVFPAIGEFGLTGSPGSTSVADTVAGSW